MHPQTRIEGRGQPQERRRELPGHGWSDEPLAAADRGAKDDRPRSGDAKGVPDVVGGRRRKIRDLPWRQATSLKRAARRTPCALTACCAIALLPELPLSLLGHATGAGKRGTSAQITVLCVFRGVHPSEKTRTPAPTAG
jgi:hypothetical protein